MIPLKTFNPSQDPHRNASRAAMVWNAENIGLKDPTSQSYYWTSELHRPFEQSPYRFVQALSQQLGEGIYIYRLPTNQTLGGTRLLINYGARENALQEPAHLAWIKDGVWLQLDP